MDWLSFIAAVVQALAWPIVALVCIYIFRDRFYVLLNLITRVKYKDLDLEFKRDIEEIERNADELPEAEVETKWIEIKSPVETVLDAWSDLESAMSEKLKELVSKDSPNRWRLAVHNASYEMLYTGVFPPKTKKVVEDLQRLRNQFSHMSGYVISKEDAQKYVMLVKQVQRFVESLTELPAIKLTALTLLILELNILIDSGKYDDISIEEIYSHIESKTIFDFLKEKAGKDMDLSLFGDEGPYKGFKEFYLDWMENFYNAYGGDHRRKWGVENKGLCLLLAWTNEIIQQGSGWHPSG